MSPEIPLYVSNKDMGTPLFKSSKLKIERTDKHIFELNAILESYVANINHVGSQVNPHTGAYKLHILKTTPLPKEAPLIIGDVVHNLHTALDLAIWDVVPKDNKFSDRNIKFPFYERREEFLGQMSKGKIKTHAREIADLIIAETRPYKGGNDDLYGLHALDIMDKHQLLIPIVDRYELVPGGSSENDGFFIDPLAEFNPMTSLPHAIKFTDHGKAAFYIVFDKGQVFERKSVIPMLHHLSKMVSGIIEKFETALA